MNRVGEGARPLPAAAYERWLDKLRRTGWSAQVAAEPAGVAEALGRVTAVPVTALRASPRLDCAAMDGIAVRAADLGPAARAARGSRPDATPRLPAGSFSWIDTGDPMPD